jgi:hypothetical protein
MGEVVVVSVKLPRPLYETLRSKYCDKRGLDNSKCIMVVIVEFLDLLEGVLNGD